MPRFLGKAPPKGQRVICKNFVCSCDATWELLESDVFKRIIVYERFKYGMHEGYEMTSTSRIIFCCPHCKHETTVEVADTANIRSEERFNALAGAQK